MIIKVSVVVKNICYNIKSFNSGNTENGSQKMAVLFNFILKAV